MRIPIEDIYVEVLAISTVYQACRRGYCPSCPAVWHSPTLRYPGDRRGTFRMGICSKHIQYNRCIDAVFYRMLCTESGVC